MTEIAISVKNLSKCYEIYEQPVDRLKQSLYPYCQELFGLPSKQFFREFWALRDVSFDIRKGETFGIIGRNGSGKSTLLQLICGTLNPTHGSIQANGRIAALLELGSGFNVEFTGRENIYLNGTVLGLSKEELDARLDDILAFADIGDFIDQPVKTYSSGMFVRLAFAIQVNASPEILIVDEALSVGDFFFQQKCFARLRKMREDGLTLLFVSHDMGTVRDLCPQALYLSKGQTHFIGDSQVAIRNYLSEGNSDASNDAILHSPTTNQINDLRQALDAVLPNALWSRSLDTLEQSHRLLAVVVSDANGHPTTAIRMGQKLVFMVFYRTQPTEQGHISFALKNKYDQIVFSSGSYLLGISPLYSAGEYTFIEFEIDVLLEAGLYSAMLSFGQPNGANRGETFDSTTWFGPLRVEWDYERERAPFLGMFGLPVHVRRRTQGTDANG